MDLNNTILIILGIITGIQILSKISVISFTLLVSLIILGYGITKDYVLSLSIACIVTYIIILLNTNEKKDNLEEFLNRKNVRNKGNKKNRSKLKNTQKNEKNKAKKLSNINNSLDEEEHLFDSNKSFAETLKSLSPSQIRGLNDDTKQLIKTQQNLLETLKTMGPAIKDGKSVLDTFKNYFGNDADLGKILK